MLRRPSKDNKDDGSTKCTNEVKDIDTSSEKAKNDDADIEGKKDDFVQTPKKILEKETEKENNNT